MDIRYRSWLSNFEMSFLKRPDFFPNRQNALEERKAVCVGTKSRNLGDALILTPLVQALKKKHPEMRIYSFARAFNPVVFYNNPFIEGVCHLPDRVYGDDCNWNQGHVIHQKHAFFEVPLSVPAKPEIFLTESEKKWSSSYRSKKPLCVVHCSGVTWKNLLPRDFWESLIKTWEERFTFIQVGVQGDSPVQGAQSLFLKKNFWNARQLFSVLNQASAFLGIDSGPMHAARVFSLPSLIFIKGSDSANIFENRSKYPYFVTENRKFGTLYEENTHVRIDGCSELDLFKRVSEFFEAQTQVSSQRVP